MERRSSRCKAYCTQGAARLESVISLSLFLVLILIGIFVFLQQFRFDETRFDLTATQAGQTGSGAEVTSGNASPLEISGIEPVGFVPMSDMESFDRITLSDKINGKADGYLEAGFYQLSCRRFFKDSNPDAWFEFYLYDMELPRNAFSVYSKQKREGVADQDFTEFAYATENAVFAAHGRYYIEIIAAMQDPTLVADMIQMADNFIETQSAGTVTLPELAYMPSENLDSESVSLISKNAFGYEKFNNIFTGTYDVNGQRVMAFISIRETPEEASSLVAGYDAILSEFIGDARIDPGTDKIPGLVIVDLFDEYEIFFSKGNILAGVHTATDQQLGEEIAVNLYNQISNVAK